MKRSFSFIVGVSGFLFLLLFCGSAFLGFSGTAQAYITINGGNLSGTLMADSTYYVLATPTVQNLTTLIVPKGVVMKFNTGTYLTVYGTLSVDGSLGMVYFTSLLPKMIIPLARIYPALLATLLPTTGHIST